MPGSVREQQAAIQELSTREMDALVTAMAGQAPKPEAVPRPTRLQALVRDEDKLVAEAELAAADPARAAAMLRDIASGEAVFKRMKKALKTRPRARNTNQRGSCSR